ncbi:hypothetical protein ACN9J5_07400 [Aliarcobacter butzleri]|uniref:hypothetical protein n=1 Tax=Aliarcobacter butzleri TaxID=28197 RepID=UPI003AF80C2F
MEKLKEKFFNLERAYKILVFLTISFLLFIIIMFIFIYLDYRPNGKFENITKLIPAIGIILSALLASVSVLKSIENTNRIEEEKKEKEKKQFLNKLRIYIAELEYFIKLFKTTFCNYDKATDIERKTGLLIYQKNLNHSKNLIIKDINFIEHIESDEYELIHFINSIEILIDLMLEEEYEEETKNIINENIDSLEEKINKIKLKRVINGL